MDDYFVHPRCKFRFRDPKISQVFPNPDKTILNNIFGIIFIVEEPESYCIGIGLMAFDNFFKSRISPFWASSISAASVSAGLLFCIRRFLCSTHETTQKIKLKRKDAVLWCVIKIQAGIVCMNSGQL